MPSWAARSPWPDGTCAWAGDRDRELAGMGVGDMGQAGSERAPGYPETLLRQWAVG